MFSTLFLFAINPLTVLLFIIGISVPIIILCGILFVVLRRKSKGLGVWKNVTLQLNFNMPNSQKLEMLGVYKDCKLKVAIRDKHKAEYGDRFDRTEKYTFCTTEFSQPLNFSLEILSKKRLLSNNVGIEIGHTDFDKAFSTKCSDENYLKTLLFSDSSSDKSKSLLKDLIWAKQFFTTVEVTEKRIYVEKYGVVSNEKDLFEMLEVTTHLENSFNLARKNL